MYTFNISSFVQNVCRLQTWFLQLTRVELRYVYFSCIRTYGTGRKNSSLNIVENRITFFKRNFFQIARDDLSFREKLEALVYSMTRKKSF